MIKKYHFSKKRIKEIGINMNIDVLRENFRKDPVRKIESFDGNYRFLSNFSRHGLYHPAYGSFPTNEHFFQFIKVDNTDPEEVKKHLILINSTSNPGVAKSLGKKVKLRKDWDIVKIKYMYEGLKLKFDQNDDIREKLIELYNAELIEGNTWGDTFWGVYMGQGTNYLGILLMELRDFYIGSILNKT